MVFDSSKVSDFIIKWLEDYADSAGLDAFVVGVSGGVDSAVTACLCARSGKPTFIVNMPIHQSDSEVQRSDELVAYLLSNYSNVVSLNISLTEVYDTLSDTLPSIEDRSAGLALTNAQARLRMTTLYALAAQRSGLVVGTGNKVEDFGVGFYTKYGDGGVDISPIADLMKSEVFLLGEHLDVPKSILTAAPTDGLWGDDRNDEDQIGASYPELEIAMNQSYAFSSGNGFPSDLTGREAEVYAIYSKLNSINQHKMQPIPVCLIPRG